MNLLIVMAAGVCLITVFGHLFTYARRGRRWAGGAAERDKH
jgi:hypothetical protein